MPTTAQKTTAPKWERVGTARVIGLGVRIDCSDGRAFAIAGDDLARFIFEGEPATVYEIDPTGAAEPRQVGKMDLSQSRRMILLMIDGEEYTALQMPAADLVKHYQRADRRRVPVMAPPTPSPCMAVPA